MGNITRFPTPHASSHDLHFRNGYLISVDPLLVRPVPPFPISQPIEGVAATLADFPRPISGIINLSGAWMIEGMIDLEGNRIVGGSLYGRSPSVDGLVTNDATNPVISSAAITRLTVINLGTGGGSSGSVAKDCYVTSSGGVAAVAWDMRGLVVDAPAGGTGIATTQPNGNVLLRSRVNAPAGATALDSNLMNIVGQNIFAVAAGAIGLDATGAAGASTDRQAYVANLKVGDGDGFGPGTSPVDPTRGGLRVMYSGSASIVGDGGATQGDGGNPVTIESQYEAYLMLANGQTLNLPPAATVPNKTYRLKSRLPGIGTFTVVPNGAELINGAASAPQGARAALRIRCDGTAWYSF